MSDLPSGVKAGALKSRVRPGPSLRRRLGALVLPGYTHLVMLWLFAPIIVMVIFGFNDTHGRLNIVWSGFTLKWFADPFGVTALTNAVQTSLVTATIGAFISTVLGTMIALASHRYRFRGKALLDAVMVMNIAASEVVMGAALLTLFIASNVPFGAVTIVLAQVMFSIPFVAITVRARLVGFDNSLEEAAQDLGASPLTTFMLVTLPIIFPGVLAAALLAFALCLDDYVITSFVSGNTLTFPLWVYGATRLGIPPQVNVIGTFIFLAGALLAVSFAVIRSWRNRQLARESAL
ncbi:MAG: spermidine/putrescine transport system permease protein [Chloroflexota bacterium]|nr:spermidine/putrescine transport system permease protein [Chloroflexota bacterium]